MTLRIELHSLREDGDQTLTIDHRPNFFDLSEEEDWRFEDQVTGQVTFHLSGQEVFATGELRARAIGRCCRCLAPVPADAVAPIRYVYLPPDQEPTEDIGFETVRANAPDVAYHCGEAVEPLDELRESILLALPTLPHCGECERKRDEPVHREDWPNDADGEPEWKRKLRGLREG